MNNLRRLLTQPLKTVPTSLAIVILVVALLGFADATYLTIEHYKGAIPPCSVLDGCETVLTSAYSEVFGMPLALFGSIYYLFILIGAYAYIDTKNTRLLKWTLFLTFAGFLMSLGLVYIMAFELKALCLYCMGSALTSTILCITSLVIFRKYGSTEITGEQLPR